MIGVTEETSEEYMLFRHGETSTLGVLETHVQPTFSTPILAEAVQECDTPQTPQHDHDNCQNLNLPHAVPNTTTTQELVVSIPIHFEVQNEYNEDMANVSTFLEDGTLNNPRDEIEFPPDYFTNAENHPTSSDHEPDQHDYIIETETDVRVNEIPPPLQYPIINCEQDIELQEDIDNGWLKVENDQVPDHCHFIGNEGLNMNTTSRNPEDFFNNLFDDRMYTIMAEETNKYARQQIRKVMGSRDPFQHMDHYSYRQHACLSTWKDLNSSDIKIFLAHLLIMSSVRKPALHSYWATTSFSRTPFFGQYGRNKFQDILWNLHVVADTTGNPPPGLPNHDPLAKVRPLVVMCQDNFKLTYKPGKHIAVDKSTLTYKGWVKFLQYSKNKPNRFHIKLFMVSESETGYIFGFSVYTGRASNELLQHNSTLDPDCTVTTKTVMSLLDKCNLLDDHRTLYFDNWFNSPQLLLELR